MAADFNAGSIEGTLDLDLTPFAAGLRKAKTEGDDFARKKYRATAQVNMDSGEFAAKDTAVKASLSKIDHEKVTAKADLDISEAEAKAAILNRTLSKALDAGGAGKALTPGLAIGKIALMASGLLSLAAAAGPATAAVIGFGSAAGVAFGGAALSLGLFAKMVSGDFAQIQKAVKANQQLAGSAGVAETAYKHLTAAWTRLQKVAGGGGFTFLAHLFNGLAAILPRLAPLIKTVTAGMDGLVRKVLSIAHTPVFAQFLSTLQKFMHGFLAGAGPILKSLLGDFMRAFIVLQPLIDQLGHGIQSLAAHLSGFTNGGGLATFVGYVEKVTPEVLKLVGDLIHGLGNIGKGLAPLAGPAIHFLDALVRAIGSVNLAPLSAGLGAVLSALQPILPVAVALINVALKPLGALLGALAHGPLAAISHSLLQELRPAFKSLHGILTALVHPLAKFIGSIANLANPTGVSLVAKLLKLIEGPVKVLAPAIGRLAVAFESVIDHGITAILPLLPKLHPLLMAAAHAAAALATGLAKILSHRGVALALLGVVGALKAFSIIHSVYSNVTYLVGALRTLMGIAKADGAIAALGSLFPRLAAGLAAVKDMAIGTRIELGLLWVQAKLVAIWGKVAAAATKAWGIIQAVFNTIMEANPIILIVTALGLLVVGLVEAYKHSKTFRDIVNGAFHAVADAAKAVFNWLKNAVVDVVNFIKDHWQLLLAIFMGPLGIVVGFVITHFSQIRDFIMSAISAAVNFVSNAVNNIVGFFRDLPGKIGNFAGDMLNAGEHLMSSIWSGLKNIWNDIWSWVSGLPGKIVSIFSNIGGSVMGAIHNAISGAVNSLPGPLASLAHHIGLASGGVTTGVTQATIGDNPGGREAVIPLDKYDIPSKGDTARTQAALLASAQASNASVLGVLRQIAQALSDIKAKTGTPEDLAKAVGSVSDANMRAMVQIARAS